MSVPHRRRPGLAAAIVAVAVICALVGVFVTAVVRGNRRDRASGSRQSAAFPATSLYVFDHFDDVHANRLSISGPATRVSVTEAAADDLFDILRSAEFLDSTRVAAMVADPSRSPGDLLVGASSNYGSESVEIWIAPDCGTVAVTPIGAGTGVLIERDAPSLELSRWKSAIDAASDSPR